MRALAGLALVALGLAVVMGGTAPFARVALALGMPGLAVRGFDDPEWRGVAHFRAEDHSAAVAAFAAADAGYNLGVAQAHLQNYAAALETFDLAAASGDADARANFDVVAAFYAGLAVDPDALGLFPERKDGPEAESFVARGDGRAAGTGDEVTNTNTMLGLAELESRGRLGVRRVFDDRFMIADERWLEQLSDVPGEYMAARIQAEYKRRVKAGEAPPEPEDPQ